MKSALYPGTFDPWHEGHLDTLNKALQVFDFVHVCRMVNPAKDAPAEISITDELRKYLMEGRIAFCNWPGLMVDAVAEYKSQAVIRGLRNGHDLQYEMNLQYWNEQLGLKVPIIYLVSDKSLAHYSSSAIRGIQKFKGVDWMPSSILKPS